MHWALDYVGLPWSTEYHCWTLLQAVYRDQYNTELPDMQYDAASLLAAIRAFGDGQEEYSNWQLVATPIEGDAVVMSVSGRPRHIGVWVAIDDGVILHNIERVGAVLSDLVDMPALGFGIQGYYRRVANG